MRYSQEFKDSIVARILAKELTAAEAHSQHSVALPTIYGWLRQARQAVSSGATTNAQGTQPMTTLKLPKGVTYLQAYEAVVLKKALSETDFGQYCRRQGLLSTTVDQWVAWFASHPNAVDEQELVAKDKALSASQSTVYELRQTNAKQAQELSKKDKALANAATMLMLSKKAQAIWGDKEN